MIEEPLEDTMPAFHNPSEDEDEEEAVMQPQWRPAKRAKIDGQAAADLRVADGDLAVEDGGRPASEEGAEGHRDPAALVESEAETDQATERAKAQLRIIGQCQALAADEEVARYVRRENERIKAAKAEMEATLEEEARVRERMLASRARRQQAEAEREGLEREMHACLQRMRRMGQEAAKRDADEEAAEAERKAQAAAAHAERRAQAEAEERKAAEERRQAVMARRYNDVSRFEERVDAMRLTEQRSNRRRVVRSTGLLTRQQLGYYRASQKATAEVFRAIDFEPNNNQYAVAAVAAANIARHRRLLLQVGPGLGKSRIWAVLVYMLKGDFRRFRVLFTSDDLREREAPAFETLSSLGIEVSAESKEDITHIGGAEDELVIIDEADDFLLDSDLAVTAPAIVGLTATALDDLEDDAAADYLLQHLGFAVYDSAIASGITTGEVMRCTLE